MGSFYDTIIADSEIQSPIGTVFRQTAPSKTPAQCQAFRQELIVLQQELIEYTKMLGAMAEVEDWTRLEANS